MTFITFVTERRNPLDGAREGFFQAAYLVMRDEGSSHAEMGSLRSLVDWFSEHLEEPDRLNRSRSSKGSDRPSAGISWFKPTAKEHIAKAFELIAILKEHGNPISILRTERPGFVIYEDEHQIVAEPSSETLT